VRFCHAGRRFLCWFLPFIGSVVGQRPINGSSCAEWNRPQTSFRMFGNTYYVGPHGVSSILIPSEAGNILIEGPLSQSAAQIVANLGSLGFRIEDVKIIVNCHVHLDQAGGIAEFERQRGARVYASPWTARGMRKGAVARDHPQHGVISPIARVKNVTALHDGETLKLGAIKLTAHLTPGHTPGGTSWNWQAIFVTRWSMPTV
jgi:metallo-beta-lactamase class B